MCGRVCSECVLERRPRVGRLLKAEASGSNADQLGRLVLPTVEYNNHTHWNAYFVFNLTTVFQPYCAMCSPPFDRIMYRLFSGISSKHFFDCRIYQPNQDLQDIPICKIYQPNMPTKGYIGQHFFDCRTYQPNPGLGTLFFVNSITYQPYYGMLTFIFFLQSVSIVLVRSAVYLPGLPGDGVEISASRALLILAQKSQQHSHPWLDSCVL